MSSNKSFGIVFCIVFLIIAFFPLIYGEPFLVHNYSSILTPLNIIWTKFGMLLGKFVSPIIMGLVFFGVVTPTGLIMKIFKKDLLNLKRKNIKSYWIEKKSKSDMKNQF